MEEKLSRRSLNLAHRIRWLAAGTIMAPGTYLEPLERLVRGRDDRIRKMAAFFAPDESLPFLVESLDARTLQALIGLMGRTFEPIESRGWVTAEMRAAEQVDRLIHRLGSLTGDDAALALDALVDDEALSKWRVFWNGSETGSASSTGMPHTIIRIWSRFARPSATALRPTPETWPLCWWIVWTTLPRISATITLMTGASTGMKALAVVPNLPKSRSTGRDALLSDLRKELPAGVIAEPEVEYSNDKRADVGVFYGGFNVPVEIKRDQDPRLWSALRDQLIAQYTTIPATGGHGVYLVFWFGDAKIPPSSQGRRPTGPAELRRRLEEQLTESERRRIAVHVIDVSPGGKGGSS